MRVRVQASIDAPFDDVLRLLGDFGGIGRWHPAFESCELEGEGVGAVRTCAMAGGVVRDRLEELAEGGYRYRQLDGPIPAGRHEGYLWVRKSPQGTATVEWSASIRGGALPDEIAASLYEGIFEAGLLAAKERLESASR